MTSRPVFGDFLRLAVEALHGESDVGIRGGEDVQQTCESLARVVAIMRQYLQDPPRNPALFPAQKHPLSPEWERARTEARQALANAAAWLRQPPRPHSRRLGGPHASWLAHRLQRTRLALTAGRDLLNTHFAQSPDCTWYPRTEWAEVLASPQASRGFPPFWA